MNKEILLEDVIALFLSKSIYDIKHEKEIPNINFHFKKEDYELLAKIMDNQKFQSSHIYQDDIAFLIRHSNDKALSIEIDDSLKIFKYLTKIINETIKLFYEYGDYVNIHETAIYLLRRIWLRMGVTDVIDINRFLEKQLQFIKNRLFDRQEQRKIGNFETYDIFMRTKANDLWDETTRSMIFTIKNNDEIYELPHILYDIDDDKTCYIYGVQSADSEKNKHIERKLYHLNKGINNPNVHPSKVCSMLFFIKALKHARISNIIIPSMQVLSYSYHELLSIESKNNYEEIKKQCEENPNDLYLKNRYQYLKNWYLHVYQKQDKISYLKTEELIYLAYRITFHDSSIEIINEVNIEGDSLNIKIKR